MNDTVRAARCSCGTPLKSMPVTHHGLITYCPHCDRGCHRNPCLPCGTYRKAIDHR